MIPMQREIGKKIEASSIWNFVGLAIVIISAAYTLFGSYNSRYEKQDAKIEVVTDIVKDLRKTVDSGFLVQRLNKNAYDDDQKLSRTERSEMSQKLDNVTDLVKELKYKNNYGFK